jgi:hypothetical protein
MPLLDHFHPPLYGERHWESFHAAWAAYLAEDLNRRLPEGYFAEEFTHAGAVIEIDVGTFEGFARTAATDGSATATLPPQVWTPPTAAFTIPAVFADDFEVRVFSRETGPTLVAAIELVSPRNNDRATVKRALLLCIRATNKMANGRRQPAGYGRHQPADAGRSPIKLVTLRRDSLDRMERKPAANQDGVYQEITQRQRHCCKERIACMLPRPTGRIEPASINKSIEHLLNFWRRRRARNNHQR